MKRAKEGGEAQPAGLDDILFAQPASKAAEDDPWSLPQTQASNELGNVLRGVKEFDLLPDGMAKPAQPATSSRCGGASSPSHLATTAVATELPTTLVADRAMSRKWSTPRISSRPASGMSNCASVAAITTSDARGTPAMPLDVSIRISSIVICVPIDRSMP